VEELFASKLYCGKVGGVEGKGSELELVRGLALG